MNILESSRNIISAKIAGLLLFCLSAPYFFWSFIGNQYIKFILESILAFLFFKSRFFSPKDRYLLMLFIITALLYWFTSGKNFNFFVLLLPVLCVPFCKSDFTKRAYEAFINIYTIIITISIIEYILAIFGIISPTFSIPPLNSLKTEMYHVFFTLVSIDIVPTRFMGPFDEPGVVGTISAIILCVEKFNFSKKSNIIIFLAGLLSMSLFFYVSIIISWLLVKFGHKLSLISLITVCFVVLISIMLVNKIPILSEKIGNRLIFDSETGFSGDNRVNMVIVNDYLNSMRGNTLLFGIKNKEFYLSLVQGSSSIYNTIIVHGLLFIVLYSTFFLIYAFKNKTNVFSFIVFVFIFFATIYQRPNIFSFFYIFMFTYLAKVENRIVK